MTVDGIINEVLDFEKKGIVKSIHKRDLFEMPVVKLDCMRQVEEMKGRSFSNPELKGYMISVMMEALKLKIDESGAKVESRAVMVGTKCPVINKQKPKEFIFNRTFWVVMK